MTHMHRHTHHAARRLARGAAVISTLAAAALTMPLASAVPPGGAGPDTPGTSASVSPTTVEQCGTLRYTVSGYPAGETLSVKIDDGAGYSDQSVHGSGVVSRQRISSDGTASGSLRLDCGMKPGDHWLRFLASKEKTDDKGNYLGVIGFTHRGGADFTVVEKKSSSGANASNNDSNNHRDNASNNGGAATNSGGTKKNNSTSDLDQFRAYLNTIEGDNKGTHAGNSNTRNAQAAGTRQQASRANTNNNPAGNTATGGSQESRSSQAGAQDTQDEGVTNVTLTSVVTMDADPGDAVAAAAVEPSGSDDASTSGDSNASENTSDGVATVSVSAPADSDSNATGDGTSGSGDQAATDGAKKTDKGTKTNTAAAPAGNGGSSAPTIGLIVGGAILLVGLMGTGAFLYVNKNKRS